MHNGKKGQTPIAKMVLREMVYNEKKDRRLQHKMVLREMMHNDKKRQTPIDQKGTKRNDI